MSAPYFGDMVQALRLIDAAESWVGTPFAIGAKVKGAGVDCVGFVAEVLRECGHLDSYEFPAYSIDGGDHLGESLVEGWLKNHPRFLRLDPADILLFGDVLEFRIGRGVSHHVGLYCGTPRQMIWSAMAHDGVRQRTMRDATWGRRLVSAWRPIEEGVSQ